MKMHSFNLSKKWSHKQVVAFYLLYFVIMFTVSVLLYWILPDSLEVERSFEIVWNIFIEVLWITFSFLIIRARAGTKSHKILFPLLCLFGAVFSLISIVVIWWQLTNYSPKRVTAYIDKNFGTSRYEIRYKFFLLLTIAGYIETSLYKYAKPYYGEFTEILDYGTISTIIAYLVYKDYGAGAGELVGAIAALILGIWLIYLLLTMYFYYKDTKFTESLNNEKY